MAEEAKDAADPFEGAERVQVGSEALTLGELAQRTQTLLAVQCTYDPHTFSKLQEYGDKLSEVLALAEQHAETREQTLHAVQTARNRVMDALQARRDLKVLVQMEMGKEGNKADGLWREVMLRERHNDRQIRTQTAMLSDLNEMMQLDKEAHNDLADCSKCCCFAGKYCDVFESSCFLWFLVLLSLVASVILIGGIIERVQN